MANTNTTTYVVDTIFAMSLMALRENSIMPRYVNRGYDTAPGDKMSTIRIPVPSAISASAVTPSYVPPDDSGISPTYADISLNKWYETAFFLNDKEVQEIVNGVFEGQISEAVKGLVNQVDDDILSTYVGVYGYGGTAGTTPFSTDFSEFTEARKALAGQLAPKNPRTCVINEDAEANALGLRAIQDASYKGDAEGLREGEIGRVLGAMWVMDQNIPEHTTGAAGTPLIDYAGAYAVGTTTVHMDGFTTKPSEGDVFTIAGDSQTYVVSSATDLVGTDSDVTFAPGLKVAIATADGNEAVTFKASHKVNLLFHRDAFALAARPMIASDPFGLNPNRRSVMDPVSGLSLTMEISRQHYRTRIAMSSLYGVKCVRPALAARIAGETG